MPVRQVVMTVGEQIECTAPEHGTHNYPAVFGQTRPCFKCSGQCPYNQYVGKVIRHCCTDIHIQYLSGAAVYRLLYFYYCTVLLCSLVIPHFTPTRHTAHSSFSSTYIWFTFIQVTYLYYNSPDLHHSYTRTQMVAIQKEPCRKSQIIRMTTASCKSKYKVRLDLQSIKQLHVKGHHLC